MKCNTFVVWSSFYMDLLKTKFTRFCLVKWSSTWNVYYSVLVRVETLLTVTQSLQSGHQLSSVFGLACSHCPYFYFFLNLPPQPTFPSHAITFPLSFQFVLSTILFYFHYSHFWMVLIYKTVNRAHRLPILEFITYLFILWMFPFLAMIYNFILIFYTDSRFLLYYIIDSS